MINLRALISSCVPAIAWAFCVSSVAFAQLSLPRGQGQTTTVSAASTGEIQRALDYIVVIVNSEPITHNEILQRQARQIAQWQAQGVKPPPAVDLYSLILERTIEDRATLQVAKERGMKISEDQLNDALLRVARQNQIASIAQLKSKYEANGASWTRYLSDISNELLMMQLRDREVDSKIRVSDSEIDAEMRALTSSRKPNTKTAIQQINVAQLLVALPENPTEEQIAQARAKATQLATQARGGEDFTKLVQQYSDATDKAVGGVMGLRAAERYPELFVQMVGPLKVGEISNPERSGAGFHVLKLLSRAEQNQMSVTQSRVNHILLPISAGLNEEQAKNHIREFKRQIEQKQTSFETLAKEHSSDGSAQTGGDLGWASPGLFVPEFETAMNRLAIGELSEPVVTQFGVHLIKVSERKEVLLTEREQREQIKAELSERKSEEAYRLWVFETRNRAYVEYRNQAAK